MHHQVGLENVPAFGPHPLNESFARFFHPGQLHIGVDFDPLGPGGDHQVLHHLASKGPGDAALLPGSRPVPPGPGRAAEMGKLEGDKAPAHKHQTGWQALELQEIAAGDQVPGAREGQRHGMGPGGQGRSTSPAPNPRVTVRVSGPLKAAVAGDKIDARPLQTLAGGQRGSGR